MDVSKKIETRITIKRRWGERFFVFLGFLLLLRLIFIPMDPRDGGNYLHGTSVSGGAREYRHILTRGHMTAREYRQILNRANMTESEYPNSISSHHHTNLNRSENDMLLTRMPFRRTNRPPRRVAPQAQAVIEERIRPHLRILLEQEGVAVSGNNFIDDHSDVQLEIDQMSYEELLLLEELVGNVKTGLTEAAIARHLKRRTHASHGILGTDQDAEICTICQDEYKDLESIGSLDCGHEYHAECIKTWLLVKNVCPICKALGLNVDR